MNRNLLLYLISNGLSLTGSWIHYVALYWLVFKITQSPMMLGMISLVSCLPILFFSFIGGATSDRLPRKKVLIIVQLVAGCLALLLSVLCKRSINIEILLLFCLAFGIVSSFGTPVKQAIIPNIIEDKKLLPKAISWNIIINHIARVLGPLICSLFLFQDKIYFAFALDSVTYFASSFIACFVTIRDPEKPIAKKTLFMIKEGFLYVYEKKILFYTILTSSICAFCIGPYTAQLPSLVNESYFENNSSMAVFYMFTGIGGLFSAIFIRFLGSQDRSLPNAFFYGFFIAGISLSIFLSAINVTIGYISLIFVTLGIVLANGACSIFIQNYIEDSYRGRVMGFYQTLTIGMLPISNIVFGILSEFFSTRGVFVVSSCLALTSILILFIYRKYSATSELTQPLVSG